MVQNKIQLKAVLNRASNGLSLAEEVLDALKSQPQVVVDFASVERITPSYANAFVMTLLDELPIEVARRCVVMENRAPHVARSLSQSAQRYLQGVRLSNQRLSV